MLQVLQFKKFSDELHPNPTDLKCTAEVSEPP